MAQEDKHYSSNQSMGNQNEYGTIGSQSQDSLNDQIRQEVYGDPNQVEQDEENKQEDPYGQDHDPYGKDQFSIEGGQRQFGNTADQYANEGGIGQAGSDQTQ